MKMQFHFIHFYKRNLKAFLSVALCLCIFVVSVQSSFSQTDSTLSAGEQETLLESQATDDDFKYDLETASLKYFKEHPLNVNRATSEQLRSLGLLSEIQINGIIKHRELYGDYKIVYELQTVSTLNMSVIKRILPYINIDGAISDFHIPFKVLILKGEQTLIVREQQNIEQSVGYQPVANPNASNHYLGGPQRLYFKYRYQYADRLSYGALGEKDAGEEFFKGTQKQGFDFYSAHLFFKTNTAVKAVCLGDYEARFGQGLTFFTGFAPSKSALILLAKKSGNGIKPYTSSNEANYLRGVACTVQFKSLHFTPFISYKKTDANLLLANDSTNLSDDGVPLVSSLSVSGYHRTLSEVDNKNTIALFQSGANVSVEKQSYQVGATVVYSKLSAAIQQSTQPYNIFAYNGKQLLQAGLNYSYVFKNINFFGETAMSSPGSYATLNGLMANLDSKVDAVLLYRNYSPTYHTIYSKAFAEGSSPDNEKGLFTGLQLKPISRWMITAYTDFFAFPWLKYRVDAPSKGYDYLLQATYSPSKTTELYVRAALKTTQQSPSSTDVVSGIGALNPIQTNHFRFNAIYSLNKSVVLKSRAEYSFYKKANQAAEKGMLVYQEVSYSDLGKPIQVSGRYEIFNCDSYNARIYAYENDVLGSFSIPAVYGTGSRMYGMIQYDLGRHISFWLRVAETIYPTQTTTGSGLDLINKNHKTEVKVQMRWHF